MAIFACNASFEMQINDKKFLSMVNAKPPKAKQPGSKVSGAVSWPPLETSW
jgi:hypothetical protein